MATWQGRSYFRSKLLTLVGMVLFVMGLVVARQWSEDFSTYVQALIFWLEREGGWLGQAAFILMQIIVCVTGFVPASMLAIAAGAVYGLWAGFFLSTIAILIGAVGAFWLSRFFFRTGVESWILGHISLAKLDREIAVHGWKIVFLLRMSPLTPFGITSYVFGLSSVRLWDFLFGTMASLPALFAYVYTGTLAGKALLLWSENSNSQFNWAQSTVFIIGFIATGFATFYLMRIAKKALGKTTLVQEGFLKN